MRASFLKKADTSCHSGPWSQMTHAVIVWSGHFLKKPRHPIRWSQ